MFRPPARQEISGRKQAGVGPGKKPVMNLKGESSLLREGKEKAPVIERRYGEANGTGE